MIYFWLIKNGAKLNKNAEITKFFSKKVFFVFLLRIYDYKNTSMPLIWKMQTSRTWRICPDERSLIRRVPLRKS